MLLTFNQLNRGEYTLVNVTFIGNEPHSFVLDNHQMNNPSKILEKYGSSIPPHK